MNQTITIGNPSTVEKIEGRENCTVACEGRTSHQKNKNKKTKQNESDPEMGAEERMREQFRVCCVRIQEQINELRFHPPAFPTLNKWEEEHLSAEQRKRFAEINASIYEKSLAYAKMNLISLEQQLESLIIMYADRFPDSTLNQNEVLNEPEGAPGMREEEKVEDHIHGTGCALLCDIEDVDKTYARVVRDGVMYDGWRPLEVASDVVRVHKVAKKKREKENVQSISIVSIDLSGFDAYQSVKTWRMLAKSFPSLNVFGHKAFTSVFMRSGGYSRVVYPRYVSTQPKVPLLTDTRRMRVRELVRLEVLPIFWFFAWNQDSPEFVLKTFDKPVRFVPESGYDHWFFGYLMPRDFDPFFRLIRPFLECLMRVSDRTDVSKKLKFVGLEMRKQMCAYLGGVMEGLLPGITPQAMISCKRASYNTQESWSLWKALVMLQRSEGLAMSQSFMNFKTMLENCRRPGIKNSAYIKNLHGVGCVGPDEPQSLWEIFTSGFVGAIRPLVGWWRSFRGLLGNVGSYCWTKLSSMIPDYVKRMFESIKNMLENLGWIAWLIKLLLVVVLIGLVGYTFKKVADIVVELELINLIIGSLVNAEVKEINVNALEGPGCGAGANMAFIGSALTGMNMSVSKEFFRGAGAYRGVKMLYEDLRDNGLELFYFTYYSITGEDWCRNAAAKRKLKTKTDELFELIYGKDESCDISKRMKVDASWCSTVVTSIATWKSIYITLRADILTDVEKRSYEQLYGTMMKIHNQVLANGPASRNRKSPLNILLRNSVSGSGKDTSGVAFVVGLQELAHAEMPVMYPHPYVSTSVFQKPLASEYWEGYEPGVTFAVLMSEFMNSNTAVNNYVQALNWLDVGDDRPMPLNFAGVDQKGMYYAIHPVNIVTTPKDDLSVKNQLEQQGCIERRFDIEIVPNMNKDREEDWDFSHENVTYRIKTKSGQGNDGIPVKYKYRSAKYFKHLKGRDCSYQEILEVLWKIFKDKHNQESIESRVKRTIDCNAIIGKGAGFSEWIQKKIKNVKEELWRKPLLEEFVDVSEISVTSERELNVMHYALLHPLCKLYRSPLQDELFMRQMYNLADQEVMLSAYNQYFTKHFGKAEDYVHASARIALVLEWFFRFWALGKIGAFQYGRMVKHPSDFEGLVEPKRPYPKVNMLGRVPCHVCQRPVEWIQNMLGTMRAFDHYTWSDILFEILDMFVTEEAAYKVMEYKDARRKLLEPYYADDDDSFSGEVCIHPVRQVRFSDVEVYEFPYSVMEYDDGDELVEWRSKEKHFGWFQEQGLHPTKRMLVQAEDSDNFYDGKEEMYSGCKQLYFVNLFQRRAVQYDEVISDIQDMIRDRETSIIFRTKAIVYNLYANHKLEMAFWIGIVGSVAGLLCLLNSGEQKPERKSFDKPLSNQIVLSQEDYQRWLKTPKEAKAKVIKDITGKDVTDTPYTVVTDDVKALQILKFPVVAGKRSEAFVVTQEHNPTTTTTTKLSTPDLKTKVSNQMSVPDLKSKVSNQMSVPDLKSKPNNLFSRLDYQVHDSMGSGETKVYLTGEQMEIWNHSEDSLKESMILEWTNGGSCTLEGEYSAEVLTWLLARRQFQWDQNHIEGFGMSEQERVDFRARSCAVANNIVRIRVNGPTYVAKGSVTFIGGRTCTFPWHYFKMVPDWTSISFFIHDSGEPFTVNQNMLKIEKLDYRDACKCTVMVGAFMERKSIFERLPAQLGIMTRIDRTARLFREVRDDKVIYEFVINETPCLENVGRIFTSHVPDTNGVDQTVDSSIFYMLQNAPTIRGECGNPAVAMGTQVFHRDLFGIIMGEHHGACILYPICQKDFPECSHIKGNGMADMGRKAPKPTRIFRVGIETRESFDMKMYDGSRSHLETADVVYMHPTKQEFEHSPIYYELEDYVRGYDGVFRREEIPVAPTNMGYDALLNGLKRLSLNSGGESLDPEVNRLLMNPLCFKGFGPTQRGRSYGIRTLYQTIFPHGGLASFPTDKSPTFDLKSKGADRAEMWGHDNSPDPSWICDEDPERKRWINPELRKDIDELVIRIHSGHQFFGQASLALKGELTTRSKSRDKKTRIFMVSSLYLAILCKMLLGDVMGDHDALSLNPVAIGTNPNSFDWKLLYQKLVKFPNLLGGDYSGWDYSVLCIFLEAWRNWMRSLNWVDSDEAFLWIDALYKSVVGFEFIHGCRIFERVQGVCSGHYWTSIFNSFVNFVIFSVTFFALAMRNGFDPHSKDKHVIMAFYGDDNGGSCSDEVAPWYNMVSIANFVKENFNMTLTTPDKGPIVEPFLDIQSFEFLSRRFVVDDGVVKAPLHPDAIIGMLAWVRLSTVNTISDQLDQNVETALRELIMHEEHDYRRWCKFFHSIRSKYGGKFQVIEYELAHQLYVQSYH